MNTHIPDQLSDEMIWLWDNVEKCWRRVNSFVAANWMARKPNWYLGWIEDDKISAPSVDPVFNGLDPHQLHSPIKLTQTAQP